MRNYRSRAARLGALATVAVVVLSACGGGSIEEQTEANEEAASDAGGECGDLNMAVNPWVGYEASAYVVGTVAQDQLGCTVNYKELKEDVSWQGFGTGEVDVVIEDWGHPDLEKKFFAEEGDGTAEDFGPQGNVGIIGWFVPPWLAEEHPDILEWENLNKYASEFATSESGGKGQFLGADPSYVQFDEAIVSNLDLDFKVVFSGSEAASIEAFRKAEENKEWVIGYWYEPQYFNAEVAMQRVALPPYEEGCQDDPQEVACDYPETDLKKIVGTEWAASDSTAVDLVRNFTWTNEDQNVVAAYIAEDGMSPEDAAAKWIEENQDKVDAWLG
ncbi:ABC transporter substrate-binding protein [Nocardioides ganghwensis]|jgi:glycine betaine/proline transport system substrate-binding protein|uniref:Glycine/betaine ABC transporter substrate-binding protein n=1 Tax=Nocardioides ganghwensis TaxID=252230 RepID=A0A4Q2S6T8_9ACTN|nr:ABC transporter substrate-binding protein [Nocardioides ganghwensis]MBD3948110.1 ABC transporter substrate-binding protein [Nocardioides ganghwensis]RYB97265.1 glycine/betaine ABC transporter substrate-binding protein [Nocardioides ganghwensis]